VKTGDDTFAGTKDLSDEMPLLMKTIKEDPKQSVRLDLSHKIWGSCNAAYTIRDGQKLKSVTKVSGMRGNSHKRTYSRLTDELFTRYDYSRAPCFLSAG